MQQSKEQRAQGGARRPAVLQQQRPQLAERARLRQAALRRVDHQQDGQHRLVRGQTEHEGQQDRPVKAEKAPRGLQRGGAAAEQTRAAEVRVREQPQ